MEIKIVPKADTREIRVCVCKVISQMEALHSNEHFGQKTQFYDVHPSLVY